MLNYIQKLLADHAGDPSSMRVMSFVSLAAGIAVSIIGLYQGRDLSALAILAGVFVGAAFGGKVAQSSVESKTKEGS